MKNKKLTGEQREQLKLVFLDAFPDKASLERMLAFELERNLDAIAGGNSLEEIVFNLIKTANSEGWVADLVDAACKSNPENQQLQTIAQELLIESAAIPYTQQQKNRKILLDAVKFEVNARLKQSLHNGVLIELGNELQLEGVKHPWDTEIKIGLRPPEPLPENTTILKVFDSEEIVLDFGQKRSVRVVKTRTNK